MKKLLMSGAALALGVVYSVQAFAQECDFEGVTNYFLGAGAVKAIGSFLSIGVVLFFALTKKSIPGILKKILDVVSGLLGNKPVKP